MQSKKLTQFYKDYADWLRAGAPVDLVFQRRYGICSNLINWIHHKGDSYDLKIEFNCQLSKEFGNLLCPFNDCENTYGYEVMMGIAHLNKHRRKWIFDHEKLKPSFFKTVVEWFKSLL